MNFGGHYLNYYTHQQQNASQKDQNIHSHEFRAPNVPIINPNTSILSIMIPKVGSPGPSISMPLLGSLMLTFRPYPKLTESQFWGGPALWMNLLPLKFGNHCYKATKDIRV